MSIRTAVEAQAALAGGCDILDAKEPAAGPLGMPSIDDVAAIVEMVQGVRPATPISVALGELTDWRDRRELPRLPQGVTYAKLGLSRLRDCGAWWKEWAALRMRWDEQAGRPLHWIAVYYADAEAAGCPEGNAVLDAATAMGCAGLLVDTFDKSAGRLTDYVDVDRLTELAAQTQQRGLMLALAGRLNDEAVAKIAGCGVDIIGVRSAACAGGDRQGSVDAAAVKRLRRLIYSTMGPFSTTTARCTSPSIDLT